MIGHHVHYWAWALDMDPVNKGNLSLSFLDGLRQHPGIVVYHGEAQDGSARSSGKREVHTHCTITNSKPCLSRTDRLYPTTTEDHFFPQSIFNKLHGVAEPLSMTFLAQDGTLRVSPRAWTENFHRDWQRDIKPPFKLGQPATIALAIDSSSVQGGLGPPSKRGRTSRR